MKKQTAWACGALVVAMALAATSASAQDWHGGPRGGGARYYPNRGAYVRAVPGRPFVFDRPGGRFYYSGGIWYRSYGPRFVVVGPPIGVFVPVLPPYYTTVWFGGAPYYYANDSYYVWSSQQNGYEVVDPPGDPSTASTDAPQPPPPQGDDLFIYPQNGQSAEQQASDKYECHKWSSSQTGFDPTQQAGGVPPDQIAGKRADYQRAMRACLEGRGYSAR